MCLWSSGTTFQDHSVRCKFAAETGTWHLLPATTTLLLKLSTYPQDVPAFNICIIQGTLFIDSRMDGTPHRQDFCLDGASKLACGRLSLCPPAVRRIQYMVPCKIVSSVIIDNTKASNAPG
jgi:hypothetical protein